VYKLAHAPAHALFLSGPWLLAVADSLVVMMLLLGFARLAYTALRTEGSHLSHPPGWLPRRFAEFCFSKKTYTEVLEPVLSDMQKEHFEALAAGRTWKARVILARGYWAFWSAVFAQLTPLAQLIVKIWKATK
ncbi:MAG TPA: hypothetical protein VFR31_20445, partial [Thermoanaerobaculia bacterium]|nr:hypothetical protein [Thermoanaerobaculia bacterium]